MISVDHRGVTYHVEATKHQWLTGPVKSAEVLLKIQQQVSCLTTTGSDISSPW